MTDKEQTTLLVGCTIIYIIGWWIVFLARMNKRINETPTIRDMTYCFFWPIFLVKITIVTAIRLVIDFFRVLVNL